MFLHKGVQQRHTLLTVFTFRRSAETLTLLTVFAYSFQQRHSHSLQFLHLYSVANCRKPEYCDIVFDTLWNFF